MKFTDICQEATQFGISVQLREGNGLFVFVDDSTGLDLSWMYKFGGGWAGYNGRESFKGQKGAVANWCLDKAVNG